MYAIIETGGKQYMTKVGDTLYVEKLTANEGEEITIKAVAISKDGNLVTGENAGTVTIKVAAHGKAKKIIVFKYKPKKDSKKKQGHRQPYTKITIEAINA